MDSNPICHPSPAKKIKCLFLDYIQLLMIGRVGQWTRTPSATPLQPKKWNACFWITFNFWWLAGLVDGLKHCLPPLSSQKSEMLIFGLHSTSDDWPGWSMDSNPVCHPSPDKKVKCLFLDYVELVVIGWAGRWTQTPLRHPSPAKKVKCSFLDYFQLLIIGRAIRAMKVNQNVPKGPISNKKKGNIHFYKLRSTSDDRSSDPSDESW